MSPLAWTLKHAKRTVVTIIGVTVLLFGVALIFLPGPAILVIPIGLGILSTEFIWARRLLHRIGDSVPDRVKKTPAWKRWCHGRHDKMP